MHQADCSAGCLNNTTVKYLLETGIPATRLYTGNFDLEFEDILEFYEPGQPDIQLELYVYLNFDNIFIAFYEIWGDKTQYIGLQSDFDDLDNDWFDEYRNRPLDLWSLGEACKDGDIYLPEIDIPLEAIPADQVPWGDLFADSDSDSD